MFVKYYKPFKILYNTGTERQILIKKIIKIHHEGIQKVLKSFNIPNI